MYCLSVLHTDVFYSEYVPKLALSEVLEADPRHVFRTAIMLTVLIKMAALSMCRVLFETLYALSHVALINVAVNGTLVAPSICHTRYPCEENCYFESTLIPWCSERTRLTWVN